MKHFPSLQSPLYKPVIITLLPTQPQQNTSETETVVLPPTSKMTTNNSTKATNTPSKTISGLPSYANALTSHPSLNPHPPSHQQLWHFYLDRNPWMLPNTIHQEVGQTSVEGRKKALPLPPDPNSPAWRGCCYNCLEVEHDQNECPCLGRVCARCWEKGHEAKACKRIELAKKQKIEPLQPRGNLGEHLMSANRPALA